MEQQIQTIEQQKWVAKLSGYDYEIVYRLRRENSIADPLSKVPGSPILNVLFVPHVGLWENIKSVAKAHPYMDFLYQLTLTNPGKPYSWRNGLIFYKTRVVVPPNTQLIQQLLKEFHDTRIGDHSGGL